jgi:hypothetical protein
MAAEMPPPAAVGIGTRPRRAHWSHAGRACIFRLEDQKTNAELRFRLLGVYAAEACRVRTGFVDPRGCAGRPQFLRTVLVILLVKGH